MCNQISLSQFQCWFNQSLLINESQVLGQFKWTYRVEYMYAPRLLTQWAFGTHHKRPSGMKTFPDSKVHGANMGPTWGRQDPGGPHVGPINFASWVTARGDWSITHSTENRNSIHLGQYHYAKPSTFVMTPQGANNFRLNEFMIREFCIGHRQMLSTAIYWLPVCPIAVTAVEKIAIAIIYQDRSRNLHYFRGLNYINTHCERHRLLAAAWTRLPR